MDGDAMIEITVLGEKWMVNGRWCHDRNDRAGGGMDGDAMIEITVLGGGMDGDVHDRNYHVLGEEWMVMPW